MRPSTGFVTQQCLLRARAAPEAAARVIHVEPDELVTMSEIAERLERSRESIRLLISGERGSGDFPAPVSHLRTRTRFWRWPDVLRWFGTRYKDESGRTLVDAPEDPNITAMVNGYLAYRRYMDSPDALLATRNDVKCRHPPRNDTPSTSTFAGEDLFPLVGRTGFEPVTHGLKAHGSTARDLRKQRFARVS